jgi:hypothetical protein
MHLRRLTPAAQKGEDPEVLAAKKRELEAKRAAAASKSTKTFYKVTVKARASFLSLLSVLCKAALSFYSTGRCIVMCGSTEGRES